jgi:hypothetical protein
VLLLQGLLEQVSLNTSACLQLEQQLAVLPQGATPPLSPASSRLQEAHPPAAAAAGSGAAAAAQEPSTAEQQPAAEPQPGAEAGCVAEPWWTYGQLRQQYVSLPAPAGLAAVEAAQPPAAEPPHAPAAAAPAAAPAAGRAAPAAAPPAGPSGATAALVTQYTSAVDTAVGQMERLQELLVGAATGGSLAEAVASSSSASGLELISAQLEAFRGQLQESQHRWQDLRSQHKAAWQHKQRTAAAERITAAFHAQDITNTASPPAGAAAGKQPPAAPAPGPPAASSPAASHEAGEGGAAAASSTAGSARPARRARALLTAEPPARSYAAQHAQRCRLLASAKPSSRPAPPAGGPSGPGPAPPGASAATRAGPAPAAGAALLGGSTSGGQGAAPAPAAAVVRPAAGAAARGRSSASPPLQRQPAAGAGGFGCQRAGERAGSPQRFFPSGVGGAAGLAAEPAAPALRPRPRSPLKVRVPSSSSRPSSPAAGSTGGWLSTSPVPAEQRRGGEVRRDAPSSRPGTAAHQTISVSASQPSSPAAPPLPAPAPTSPTSAGAGRASLSPPHSRADADGLRRFYDNMAGLAASIGQMAQNMRAVSSPPGPAAEPKAAQVVSPAAPPSAAAAAAAGGSGPGGHARTGPGLEETRGLCGSTKGLAAHMQTVADGAAGQLQQLEAAVEQMERRLVQGEELERQQAGQPTAPPSTRPHLDVLAHCGAQRRSSTPNTRYAAHQHSPWPSPSPASSQRSKATPAHAAALRAAPQPPGTSATAFLTAPGTRLEDSTPDSAATAAGAAKTARATFWTPQSHFIMPAADEAGLAEQLGPEEGARGTVRRNLFRRGVFEQQQQQQQQVAAAAFLGSSSISSPPSPRKLLLLSLQHQATSSSRSASSGSSSRAAAMSDSFAPGALASAAAAQQPGRATVASRPLQLRQVPPPSALLEVPPGALRKSQALQRLKQLRSSGACLASASGAASAGSSPAGTRQQGAQGAAAAAAAAAGASSAGGRPSSARHKTVTERATELVRARGGRRSD